MFFEVVLHDSVVAVRVDADVLLVGKAEVHDVAEDAVDVGSARDAMDDVIGQGVVEPLAVVDFRVGGLGRAQKRKIAHNPSVFLDDEAAILCDVGPYRFERGVSLSPLRGIARRCHDALCCCEHLDDSLAVLWQGCTADESVSVGCGWFAENSSVKTLPRIYRKITGDTPALEDAELAYGVETFTATIGEDNEFPELSNPNELPVTYTSSDESVATIDEDGNITLVAAGETTITATSDETSEFKAGEASYLLIVEGEPVPAEEVQYQLVTSTDDITSGKYLIVYAPEDGEAVAFDGSLAKFDAASNIQGVIIENDVITTDQAIYFNIDVENGTLQSASGFYIGQTANSNGLKQSEDATAYTNTFAIDEDGYAVISVAVGENTLNMRYNKASDQLRFRYYKSGQQPIYLFKAVDRVEGETVPVTISSAEWATLYYSDKAFEIPEGVTAKIATAVDENDEIVLEDLDGIIPAGTAVVLNGPQGTYDFKVVNDETVAPANNLLRGFDASHLTEGGDIYYKLTVKNDIVGFYWGEENGEAFESGEHKAYLAIPAGASNAKFFVLGTAGDLVSEDGGFVDGINEVTASDSKNEYFNLNGTRVNSLRKGIYIVGGKKVVIK